jgi:acetylornithine deacetylase/succinyl-diaminopimelate desuccinylase-like protein
MNTHTFEVDRWLDESLNHFRNLLRIDTTNPPGREAAAAQYIASVLAKEGIEHVILEKAPGRSNLVARLHGRSSTEGALLLNGHLDVVPAEREQWRFDPFSAQEADGCIWARGAIDMKNMVVMSFMTLIAIKRAGLPLERDLIFAAVADEEAGCENGSLFLVNEHPELVRAAYVLNEVGGQTVHISDQRFYPIQVAEKGVCWFELMAEGQPGHGSMPHGDNAVGKIAQAVARLSETALRYQVVPEVKNFLAMLAKNLDFKTATVLRGLLSPTLASYLLGLLQRRDAQQALTFSAMLHNTATPTALSAGAGGVNVIPTAASARFDGRMLPGVTVEDFLADVKAIVGEGIQLQVIQEHEGVRFPTTTPLFDAITSTLKCFDPQAVVIPYMNPAFTDSFAYARLGAICYGFSPVKLGPELNFARMFHGHDERIPVDGYLWGQRALLHAVASFCCETPSYWLDQLAAFNVNAS